MAKKYEISIVIPIYNEEECVEKLFERVDTEAKKLGKSYEIILVDDGSKDNTRNLLRKIKENNPQLKVILFRRNCGQTPAMVAGFDHAEGEVIITMDGDLQNDPADMGKLLEKMKEGYEIVSGWRFKRQDHIIRKIPSRVANRMISALTGVSLHDYGCSLKAYKADCIREVHAYSEMHRFFPAMASITGARTAEIPVNHYAREFGKSKYGMNRIFKVFADLFTVFMLTKFTSRPSVMFFYLSLPFLVASGLFAAALGVSYLNHGDSIVIAGATFLVLFLAMHFIFLGVLSLLIFKKGNRRVDEMSRLTAVEI